MLTVKLCKVFCLIHKMIATSHNGYIILFSLNMSVSEAEKENSVKQKQVRSLTSINTCYMLPPGF